MHPAMLRQFNDHIRGPTTEAGDARRAAVPETETAEARMPGIRAPKNQSPCSASLPRACTWRACMLRSAGPSMN